MRRLILIFILCFLILPGIVKAGNELSSDEAITIVRSAFRNPISDKFVPSLFVSENSIENQAAMIIGFKAIQEKSVNYIFSTMPLNLAIELIKKTRFFASLYGAGAEELIIELEKESVKEAKKMIEGWLSENDIKIASGYIKDYSYTTLSNKKRKANLGYNVIKSPLGQGEYEIIVEVYSPNSIEPPKLENKTLVLANFWNEEDWIASKKEKVRPFIIRVKGKITEKMEGYSFSGHKWSNDTTVQVIFNEPVPEVVIPNFWDNIKDYAVDYVKSYIPDFGFLKGQASEPLLKEGEYQLKDIDGIVIGSNLDFLNEFPSCDFEISKIEQPKEISSDIQDILDDIMEKIDILTVEVKKFIADNNEIKDEEDKEDEEEEKKPKTYADKISVSLCPQNPDALPALNKVIINEVAWMGNSNFSSDEWIELKNISSDTVDIFGWEILDKNNDIKAVIPSKTSLTPNGLYLLERTDQNSAPSVLGDLIYTGGLSDSNESLSLFNQNCGLEDKVIADPDWPAGDKDEKRTMERSENLTWHNYYSIGHNGIMGTPKQENSKPGLEKEQEILITELQIESASNEKDEFVEIYNQSDEEINLTGWYIQRKTKSGDYSTFAPSSLFENKIIQSKSYLLIARKDSAFESIANIVIDYPLTNDNTLAIRNKNRQIIDKVGWGSASDFETEPAENPLNGKSLSRIWQGDEKYIDTNNNKNDFKISNQTAKKLNYKEAVWQMPLNNIKHTGRSDYAIDTASGIKWNYEFENVNLNCPSTIAGPIISNKNEIYIAVGQDACEGTEQWSKIYVFDSNGNKKSEMDFEKIINYLSLGPDGILYASAGNSVYAISDKIEWQYSNSSSGYSAISVSDDNLIYFTSYSSIFCLNPDGSLKWQSSGVFRGGNVSSGPVLDEEKVYAVWPGFRSLTDEQTGEIYAYDRLTGAVKWQRRLQFSAGPPVIGNNGDIYVMAGTPTYFGNMRDGYVFSKDGILKQNIGSQYGDLYATVISKNGKIIFSDNWSRVAGESWGVYVWQPMSQIKALNESGEVIWNLGEEESSSINSQPIIDDSGVIVFVKTLFKVYSRDIWSGWGYIEDKKIMQGIDSENGNLLFSFDTSGFNSSFAISGIGSLTATKIENSKLKLYSFGANNPFGILAEPKIKTNDPEELEIEKELEFLDEDFSDYELLFSDEIDFEEEYLIIDFEEKNIEPVEEGEVLTDSEILEPIVSDSEEPAVVENVEAPVIEIPKAPEGEGTQIEAPPEQGSEPVQEVIPEVIPAVQ